MKCLVCGNKELGVFLKTKDYSFSGDSFELKRCSSCEVVVTTPIPNNINKYYNVANYDSFQQKPSLFGLVYGFVQKINTSYKLSLLKKNKTTLDFGAGSGYFVKEANKKGFEVYGYEPINQIKNKLITKNLKDLPKEKFEQITMWHVLEHTKNPKAELLRLKKMLKNNGKVYVALPNISSYDNTYYGKHWAGFDVPRHLYHFTEKSFDNLCDQTGFKVQKKVPLYFDSFYVSMLSEKNKKNPLWPLFGLFVGLISNIVSVFTKNHSSIIYIIK